MSLFIAIMPTCFVNPLLLSYFKMVTKEPLLIAVLENDENSIMNIVRIKGR
jgi:hypothetical protein